MTCFASPQSPCSDGFPLKGKRLAGLLALAVLLGARIAASAEMDANTLLHIYDTGTPQQKTAIEQTVLTAESALREASSAIVLQRNEFGLYCPKDFSADSLIEMIRRQVNQKGIVSKRKDSRYRSGRSQIGSRARTRMRRR
jgi:hypothetical protein